MTTPTHQSTTAKLEMLLQDSRKLIKNFVVASFSEIREAGKAFATEEGPAQQISSALARKLANKQDIFQIEIANTVELGFHQLQSSTASKQKKRARLGQKNISVSLDELTLVDHDELQKQLMVGRTSTQLQTRYNNLLGEINMRIEEMIKHEITLLQNPFHPGELCHAVLRAVTKFGLPEDEVQITLKYLLQSIIPHYDTLIQAVNNHLSIQGVLPTLDNDAVQYRYEEENRLQATKEKRLSILQTLAPSEIPGQQVTENDVEDGLSTLIKAAPKSEALDRHLVKAGKQAVLLNDDEFLVRLRELSRLPDLAAVELGYPKVDDEPATLSEKVRSVVGMANYYLTDRTTNTLSMLSMLFDQMNEDNNLEAQVKHLIHHLQAPMARAAILDHMFFSDTENPAQRLLDSLASAGATWTPSANRQRDSLYNKMATIVIRINKEFNDDYSVFDVCQEDFDLFTRAEKRRARMIEERMVAAERAKARTDRARLIAARHIARLLKSPPSPTAQLPKALISFLSTAWNQVLFYIHNLNESTETAPWKNAIDLEQRLISQLDTKDEKTLDGVLKDIENLLKNVGTPEQDVTKWVETLSQAYCMASITEENISVPHLQNQLGDELDAQIKQETVLEIEDKALVTEQATKPTKPQIEAIEPELALGLTPDLEPDLEPEPEPESEPEPEPELPLKQESKIEPELADIVSFSPEPEPDLETAISDDLPEDEDIDDEFENMAANLTPNAWVQSNNQGEITKIRVAAVIKHSNKVVLVNRNGSRSATLTRQELAEKLRSGEMIVIENGMFFDRALESVIKNLRQ